MVKHMPSIPLAPAALYQTSLKVQNSKSISSQMLSTENTEYIKYISHTHLTKLKAFTETEFMLESLHYLQGALITSSQDVRFHIQVLFQENLPFAMQWLLQSQKIAFLNSMDCGPTEQFIPEEAFCLTMLNAELFYRTDHLKMYLQP